MGEPQPVVYLIGTDEPLAYCIDPVAVTLDKGLADRYAADGYKVEEVPLVSAYQKLAVDPEPRS